MLKTSLNILTRIILVMFSLLFMLACGSQQPHKMQYLVNRNYLNQIGLTNSAKILDQLDGEIVRTIHIGSPNDTIVKNHMRFDKNGNLLSVSDVKGKNKVLKLVRFRYNKDGLLKSILPNTKYYITLNYDSITIEYEGKAPKRAKAMKLGRPQWVENISFNDALEEYVFSKKARNSKQDLFDLYSFKNNKLVSEYHKNRETDLLVDSINYHYKNNKLAKSLGIFN